MKNNYKLVEFMRHCDQAQEEAIEWLFVNNGNSISESEKNAYRSGFKKGTIEAFKMLKLHAGLDLSDKA